MQKIWPRGQKKKLEIVLIFVQIVKIPAYMKKGVKLKHRLSKSG